MAFHFFLLKTFHCRCKCIQSVWMCLTIFCPCVDQYWSSPPYPYTIRIYKHKWTLQIHKRCERSDRVARGKKTRRTRKKVLLLFLWSKECLKKSQILSGKKLKKAIKKSYQIIVHNFGSAVYVCYVRFGFRFVKFKEN